MAYELTKPDYEDWVETPEHRGDEVAAALEWNLTKGLDFSIPDVDWDDDLFQLPQSLIDLLHQAPEKPKLEDITVREYGGTGIFDAFMESFHNHLNVEYLANRITGAQYAEAWVSGFQTCLTQAVTFAINRDKAYWDAILAQLQGLNQLIAFNTAKVQLAIAQAQAHLNRANYALTKLKLSTEDANYANAVETVEATRAQTLDNRLSDGQTVEGAIGKQKDLYDEQITSYKRNAELKVAQLWSDAWVAQKTIDEGLLAPAQFQNESVNTILTELRNNVNLN